MSRAFSLIELLVVVIVVALLIGLSAPSLARARQSSREIASLRTLGQLVQSNMMYAEDHGEALPFLATPCEPWRPIRFGGHQTHGSSYFLQSRLVLSLVVPRYYADAEGVVWKACEYCPGLMNSGGIYASYWMTDTAFASTGYWRGDQTPDGLSNYRGMRLADLVFPAQKGLMLSREMSLMRRGNSGSLSGYFVGRGDGSSAVKPFDLAEYDAVPSRPYMATPWPVMFTRDGFGGRDF